MYLNITLYAFIPLCQIAVVEDEWKEFEVAERKDYSGLKIGQLQIEDVDDNTVDESGNDKYDSDGELTTDSDRQRGGPWGKVDGEANAEAAAPVVAAPVQPLAGGLKSVYISPAMRDAQAQVSQVFTITQVGSAPSGRAFVEPLLEMIFIIPSNNPEPSIF